MTTANHLQQRIMRRIYLAFGLRLALHPLSVLSLVGVVTLLVLARLVFVAKVLESFLATPLGGLPNQIIDTIAYADMLTLIMSAILGLVVVALFKQLGQLRHLLAPRKQAIA